MYAVGISCLPVALRRAAACLDGSRRYVGVGHYFVCLDGCCELCTWLLNNVFLMKELGLDKIQPLFALNGLLLWLSYIVFRLVLFPAWLYVYFTDTMSHPHTTLAFLTSVEQVRVRCGTHLPWLALSARGYEVDTCGRQIESWCVAAVADRLYALSSTRYVGTPGTRS
jgi:hypothetical protein